jgi:Dyp-type peroxidase family
LEGPQPPKSDGQLEVADIQGLVASGYKKLRAASYLLLRASDPAKGRKWLAGLADRLTNAAAPVTTTGLNVAFTHGGLQRLGLAKAGLKAFPSEFIEGIATPHRSRMLGDIGRSAPQGWRWGGDSTKPVDLLVMLFAVDPPTLETMQAKLVGGLADAAFETLVELDTSDLGDREHFGFHDGISQPVIQGLGRPAQWRDSIQPGEFVLGYSNEYGVSAARPLLNRQADPGKILPEDLEGSGAADFGRNGTYLVLRQLRQDVAGFWTFLDGRVSIGGQGSAVKLASKMVGRWPSGAPLVRAPDHDDPTLGSLNDFAYGNEDPDGLRCPIGAHIRRTNPRDSLDPSPGTDRAVTLVKRHRILRRGREYGPPLVSDPAMASGPLTDDGNERGLQFICLNANLVRQFEFVQATWVASPKFDRLYDDADPIIASRGATGNTFTVPDEPFRHRLRELPQFVTVLGGGYFFMPGLRAVRYLATDSVH